MSKKQIQNERVEKNLKVLKLLSNNDPSINEEQKREVLNTYTGPCGRRPKNVDLGFLYLNSLKFCFSIDYRCV